MDTFLLRQSCQVCGESFDEAEWDARHSTDDGSDVHAECCPTCEDTEPTDSVWFEYIAPMLRWFTSDSFETVALIALTPHLIELHPEDYPHPQWHPADDPHHLTSDRLGIHVED